jgi:hypothetical protein
MSIPDRYLVAGLDALCRSYPEPKWGAQRFMDAHAGAQVLSAWFMFEEGTIDPAAAEPLLDLIDREYLPTPLFAPFGRASTADADLQALIHTLPTTVRSSVHIGHNVIFTSLALRAFQVDPRLATAERIAGLARLAIAYRNEPTPDDRLAGPEHERRAWSSEVLTAFFPAHAVHNMGIFGHLLTYGRAVDDLHALGHHHLARVAKTGWREYAAQAADPQTFTSFMRADSPAPSDQHLPNGRRYWQSRPVSFLEGGHCIKYAFAYFGHLARADDPELVRRARSVATEFSDPNPHPLTGWYGEWEVSSVRPGEDIAAMPRPAPSDMGPLEQRSFTTFVNCHDQWQDRSGHVAFFCTIDCREAMELELRIGYDGPIRLWIDDQEVHTDLRGTNPAIKDSHRRTVHLTHGPRRLTVLMALNGGKAWGFFLRFARLGLSEAELDRTRFAMPQIRFREHVGA